MLSYESIQMELRRKGVTLKTLQTLDTMFTRRGYEFNYDMELDDDSDSPYKRLEELMELLENLDIDLKYLNQYPELFTLIFNGSEEEFKQMLDDIRRKGKKRKETNINMLLVFPDAMRNNNLDNMHKIIEFLEYEGLDDIINNSIISNELLINTSFEVVYENYRTLSENVKGYRSLIRQKPQILFRCSPNELDDIIRNINESNQRQEELEKKEGNIVEEGAIQEVVLDNENGSLNVTPQLIDEKEGNLEYIGEEDELQKIYDAFSKYHISISVLLSCPDILRYRKPSDVVGIIEILYRNGIPLYILENDPELLLYGKRRQIELALKKLKNEGFNLDFLVSCPQILYRRGKNMVSEECIIDKIQDTINMLESVNINKNIIYSCPELLIIDKEVDIKVFTNGFNELRENILDINIILSVAPYVYIPAAREFLGESKENIDINRIKANNIDVVVIKDINKAQNIINEIKEKDIDISCLGKNPEILNKANPETVKDILNKMEEKKYDMYILEDNPEILYLTIGQVDEVESEIKKHRPETYRGIVQNYSNVLTDTDKEKIEKIVKELKDVGIPLDIIDQKPAILTIKEPEQVKSIVLRLRSHNITDEQILDNIDILIRGNEKYIDRNFEMLDRYGLNIPFGEIYAKSARNNEKVIDTLIENDLYHYIEKGPEILDVEHAKVLQYIILAKKEDIPLVIRDKNKKKVLNIEYFNMTPEDVSEEYGIELNKIQKIRDDIDKKPLRRILNTQLYDAVYDDFSRKADESLEKFKSTEVPVAYEKNKRKTSREKVIRETYLDLEREYARVYRKARIKALEETGDEKTAIKIAKLEAKKVLKEFDIEQQLNKKIDSLTNNKKESNKTNVLQIDIATSEIEDNKKSKIVAKERKEVD